MFRFSPLPMAAYRLHGLDEDEISVISGDERELAIWNLFWLSVPSLDHVPGLGPKWYTMHKVVLGALPAIISDVHADEVLYRKLLLHPRAFHQWFEREDHSIFDTYDRMGGPLWAQAVIDRSREAAERYLISSPPVTIEGNVIRVNFGQASAGF